MTEPTRRDILRLIPAAGGALALAFFLPGCGPSQDARVAARADRTGELAPNAWLRILPDERVVFYLDRVEMGQGTTTSHVTLLAEELEVDPKRVLVEHAPALRAYDNPDADLGFQITGGSSSVRTSWGPLRAAGAAAREMLVAAAAASWSVPVDACVARDGAVLHEASGRRATYGSLTRAAAHQPVPASPRLKPPSEYKLIGRSIDRLDARAKVDGSAVYGIDVKLPDLLVAVVVRCPVAGGVPSSHDESAARAMPGVVSLVAIPDGVAVVATSYARARAAANELTVVWEPGRLASVSSEALAAQYRARAASPAKVVRDVGAAARVYAGAQRRIEAFYDVPYLAHATMEPQNATARVTATRCEVWAPTQSPGLAREQARRITGLPYEAIDIHTTMLGGGFGRRLAQDYVAEAVYVARAVGRPVKVMWSREDDMAHDHYRPMSVGLLRGAVDADGRVTSWFHRIVAQSIVSQVGRAWIGAILPSGAPSAVKTMMARTAGRLYESGAAVDGTSIEGAADFAYGIPAMRVEWAQVEPGVPVGFWRGVGHSENAFIVESFLDELAHLGGKDPVALRRELLAGAPRHLGVLERVARESGWGTALPRGVGRGVALTKCFGSYCAQVAEVAVEGHHVRVRRVVAAIDCGQVVNPDLVRAQVEGAVAFGLSAALKQRITLKDGRVEQRNFDGFPLLRMHEMPRVEVHLVESREPPSGVGEPGLPPVAPAVANAIFAASGRRVRSLPIESALRGAS